MVELESELLIGKEVQRRADFDHSGFFQGLGGHE